MAGARERPKAFAVAGGAGGKRGTANRRTTRNTGRLHRTGRICRWREARAAAHLWRAVAGGRRLGVKTSRSARTRCLTNAPAQHTEATHRRTDTMKAILCPGQGAQTPGYLQQLPDHQAVRLTLAEASQTLGRDIFLLDSAAALESTVAVQLTLVT